MINNSNILEAPSAVVDQEPSASQPGKGKWTRLAMLAAVGITVASLTGCLAGKYTGGGFIDSAAGGGKKATFGFNLEALDRDRDGRADQVLEPVFDPETGELIYFVVWWTAKGQFAYNDHGAGVSFHTDIDETLALDENQEVAGDVWWNGDLRDDPFADGVLNEDDLILTSIVFSGPYVSKAGNGRVWITLTAKNDSFGSADDTIEVFVLDGPYAGYQNSGTVQGGNIQWHPAKAK